MPRRRRRRSRTTSQSSQKLAQLRDSGVITRGGLRGKEEAAARDLSALPERPAATSLDGRRFTFDIAVTALDLRVGDYVVVGESRARPGHRDRARPGRSANWRASTVALLETAAHRSARPPCAGRPPQEVADWLSEHRLRACEPGGRGAAVRSSMYRSRSTPAASTATPSCAASPARARPTRSGRSSSACWSQTSLRIVVLDPNSDFVRLHETRPGGRRGRQRAIYAAAARGIDVRRAGRDGRDRLHVRFRDFDADEQAAVFRLDPIADRDEYAALARPSRTDRTSRWRRPGPRDRRPAYTSVLSLSTRWACAHATFASIAGASGRATTRARSRTWCSPADRDA